MTWRLKRWAVHLVRRWRGRCLGCGRPLEPTKSIYRILYPRLCHRCGKMLNHAKVYGMGDPQIWHLLEK